MLVSRLPGVGRAGADVGQVHRVVQGDLVRHDDLLLAGSGQAEVLAGRQLKILTAVVVLVLQSQVIVLQLLELVLLVQGGYLLLQGVIGLNAFDTAPTDQQHDDHENHLPDETGIVQAPEKPRHYFKISVFC